MNAAGNLNICDKIKGKSQAIGDLIAVQEHTDSYSVLCSKYFLIRLKYAAHFLASCMALLECLKLIAKVCFP